MSNPQQFHATTAKSDSPKDATKQLDQQPHVGLLRWTYVIPRAVLVGLVWTFLTYGFDPLLRYGLISTGQRAARAKVEVAGVTTKFLSPQLQTTSIAVANRNRPGTNLVEFTDLHGKLEIGPLLKKSFIVEEASVSGLRWDTKRADSGLLPGEEPDLAAEGSDSQYLDKMKQEFLARGKDWLAGLLDRAKLDFDPGQFETVRLGQELEERWPSEFQHFEVELEGLKQRIDQLRAATKTKGLNEIEKIDHYAKAGQEVEQVLRDIEQLRVKLGQTLRQAQGDLQAMNEAKDQDLTKIKGKADIMHLDPNQVAEFLLGSELTNRFETALGWAKFIRERIQLATDEPKPERMRGETILFRRAQELPLFLVRLLNVDGQGDFGGDNIAFKGTISGVTSNPKIHGKPIIVRIDGNGVQVSERSTSPSAVPDATPSLGVQLKAVLDYTKALPEHQLVLSYKEPRPSQQDLGKSDSVQLTAVSRGVDCLADIKLVGDSLSGQVHFQQALESINAKLGDKRFKGDERVLAVVQEVVSNIHAIDAQMNLSGTALKPQFKIQSNLGHDLSTGINTAFARQLEAGRQKLIARFDSETTKQSAKLTQLYDEQVQKLTGKLQLNKSEVTEIAQAFGLKIPGGLDLKKIAGGLPIDINKPIDLSKPLDVKSLGKLPTLPSLKAAKLPKFDEQPDTASVPGRLQLPGLEKKPKTPPATDGIRQASDVESAVENLFSKPKPKAKKSPVKTVQPASGEKTTNTVPSESNK